MVLNKLNLPKAYKEVIKVIEYLPEELYVKIPEEILENLYENMDKDYEFEITNSKTVKFLKETEDILAVIYRDYLASENEKRKIELLERQEETELEEEKRKKYSPDNIFEKRTDEYEKISIVLPTIVEKKNIFKRFLDYIKRKLKK